MLCKAKGNPVLTNDKKLCKAKGNPVLTNDKKFKQHSNDMYNELLAVITRTYDD